MQDYLAARFDENPSWNHGELSEQLTFIHMDLDAFFCSVQLAKPEYAHLRDKPVGVAAGHGNSDISSCNYVARKFGVHAGMYVNAAKEICPDLVTIGYDFVACERIVKLWYQMIFENFPSAYKMAMEVYSVDDVMIATDTEHLEDLKNFCNKVREEIKDATGCTLSCGIGPNILLSRLVTSLAKPDGVYVLAKKDVSDFIRRTPFTDIHGVGHSTIEKVRQLLLELGMWEPSKWAMRQNKKGERTAQDILCADVQRVSREDLQRALGKKAGENFFHLCRGDDHRVVIRTGDKEADRTGKGKKLVTSVGCSMNYAVRPTCEEDVWKIMEEVLQDVCGKLRRHDMMASSLRLTVLERHPLHPKATVKFMGRGKCIEVHFPIKFPVPLDATQAPQMMAAMQETLRPLLVQSRQRLEGEDDEAANRRRADILGVNGNLADQTIWTVTLPSVPDLLIEDIRGMTIQANKLVTKKVGLVHNDEQEIRRERKRLREQPFTSLSGRQLTLGDMFAKSVPKKELISTAVEIESQRTSSICLSSSSTQSLSSVEDADKGRIPSPREASSREGQITIERPRSTEDVDEKPFRFLKLSSISRMQLSDEQFSNAWKQLCDEAISAQDYFLVKACLRCVAQKILDDGISGEGKENDMACCRVAQSKMEVFEQYVMDRLPFRLYYR